MITPFFHVGLVVPELIEARRELSSTLGLTWRPESRGAVWVRTNGNPPVERDFCILYSNEGPPYIELIAAGDSPWELRDGVHHLGMYTEDLAADLSRLAAENYRELSRGVDPSGDLDGFAYVASPTGVVLELIDTRMGKEPQ